MNWVLIIVICMIYFLLAWGFWIKNPYVTILGSMGLIAVGIYLLMNGFIGIQNIMVQAVSFIHMGIGGYLLVVVSYEEILEH